MTQEVLKLALEALKRYGDRHRATYLLDGAWDAEITLGDKAIKAAEEALAQTQEPVAWQTMEAKYLTLEKLDIRMGDGSILCSVWPQSDGDLWWEGSGTGEKFIDPKYANVTHWRVHSDTIPPQRTEQEPVAWLLTDKNINSLQVDSIQRLIDRLKHAHHADLCVRINGQDEWFEADWLKHMVRATPPQRTWQGLTNEDMVDCLGESCWDDVVRKAEAKLKLKNGFAEENT